MKNTTLGIHKSLIYIPRLTNDFQVNKRIIDDIAAISTKRLRNKIAGFTTHLMKRLQKGSVTGISLKLQEEEREKKLDYMPDKSAIDTSVIYGSAETRQMIKSLGLLKQINFKDQEQAHHQEH